MDIGLIHDTPTPSAEDSAIATELTTRGHAVTMIDAATTPPPAGYDVFIFSESAAAFQVADWTDTTTPLLCWETAWDVVGIATVAASSQGADNTWDLAAHDITTGLPNPSAVLDATAPSNFCVTAANLVADAVSVATAGTGVTLAVLESGDTRFDSTPAPARRACMALTNTAAAHLDTEGYDLIEATLTWLTAGTSTVAAGTAVTSFGFEGNATGTGGTPTRPVPVGGYRWASGLAADLVLDAPKGVQSGDLQFAFINVAADDEPITDIPAGWTELGVLIHPQFGGVGTTWTAAYVSTTDTGPATFHRDFVTGARAMHGVRIAYRHHGGYSSFAMANTGSTSATVTDHPIPAVTAPDGGVVFAGVSTEATFDTTFLPPTGFTERYDHTAAFGGAIDDIMSLSVADIESDGTETSGSFTSSHVCHGTVFSVAIAPESTSAGEGAGSASGSVSWAGTASGSAPAVAAGPSIGYVHDDPAPSANDSAVIALLEGAGYTVTPISEAASPPPAGTHDLIIISESGSSGSVAPYDNYADAVMAWEANWSSLRLSSANASSAASTTTLDLSGHESTTGLPDPLTYLTASASMYGVDSSTLPSGVEVVATHPTATSHCFCVVADMGAALTSGTAPARRAAMGLIDSRVGVLSSDGQDLVLAVVAWLTGAGSPASMGGATGTHAWAGSATGSAPMPGVPHGSADGTHAWAGSASGARTSSGNASGSRTWAGIAVGANGEAAALPAQIGDGEHVEQETHGYCAPVMDANGNIYRITESTLAERNQPRAMKSSDGGVTWVEMDAANRPCTDTNGIGDLESGWMTQEPGYLTFTWQRNYPVYSRFRTSDHPTDPDTWVSNTRERAGDGEGAPQYMSHTSPTDQPYQWLFWYDDATGAGSFRSRNTTTGGYDTVQTIDPDCQAPAAWLGDDNVSHILYRKSGQLHYKAMTSGGSLDAVSTRVDTNGLGTQPISHTRPVPYSTGGDDIVTAIFVNGSGGLRAVDITNGVPGAEQTITDTPVLLNPGATISDSAVISADVDGTTVHVLWADAGTGAIRHSSRPHGGAWTSPITLLEPTIGAYYVYGRVVERPNGDRVLAYNYSDGYDDVAEVSDIWYGELALGATMPTGSTTGTHAWSGSASGAAPDAMSLGSASGTHQWGGSASGAQAAAHGSAEGTFTWAGVALSATDVDITFTVAPTRVEALVEVARLATFASPTRVGSVAVASAGPALTADPSRIEREV